MSVDFFLEILVMEEVDEFEKLSKYFLALELVQLKLVMDDFISIFTCALDVELFFFTYCDLRHGFQTRQSQLQRHGPQWAINIFEDQDGMGFPQYLFQHEFDRLRHVQKRKRPLVNISRRFAIVPKSLIQKVI